MREKVRKLFAYETDLSEQYEKKAIERTIEEIESLLIPWEPSSQLMKREGENQTYL